MCADKLANFGHVYMQMRSWDSLPAMLRDDFLRDNVRTSKLS
jgi:hypothetical protein